MLKLFTNFKFHTEVEDVAKLFFEVENVNQQELCDILCLVSEIDGQFFVCTTFGGVKDLQSLKNPLSELKKNRLQKRLVKVSVYRCLSQATGKSQPWGSLTGIRPTKLAYQLIEEGEDFKNQFRGFFGVSEGKTHLVEQILDCQSGLRGGSEKTADLYISIPFCKTRCSYCSFTAGEIVRLKSFVLPYVDSLIFEVTETLNFAKSNGTKIQNVYIGGGTPTVLEVNELKRILLAIDLQPEEFTVEAGRPDTITEEKLQLFSDFSVNRISINPQTFNQRILDVVGRKHSVLDIFQKFTLARKFNFDINMDLIAGLPTETFDEFCFSVDSTLSLKPENITVHTLALKRGSLLKQDESFENEKNVVEMVEYSHKRMLENSYRPYYMYRQKYMTQNLENVGFCLAGKAGRYNINNMEETTDILACGVGAISKRIFGNENRIERSANPKDVKTYLENLPTFLERKRELFKQ